MHIWQEHIWIVRELTAMYFIISDLELMTGDFVKVKITGTNDYDLIGEIYS